MHTCIQDLIDSHSRRSPDREAIVDWDTGKRYTWGELHRRTGLLVDFLVSDLGIQAGERVGFLCPADVTMFNMYAASFNTGIVVTTYNYRLKASEIAEMLRNESPRVLFFSVGTAAKAAEVVGMCDVDVVLVCIDGDCDEALHSIPEIMERDFDPGSCSRELSFDIEAPAMLVHTGGTTGLPKAGVLSYRALFLNIVSEMASMGLSSSDVAYVCMPLYHTAGWNVFSLPLLLAGGRVVFSREFSPDVFFDVVEAERPTVFMAADMMYRSIVSHRRFRCADLSSLRYVVGGASPISPTSMQPFWEKGIRFFVGYGMTETGPNNLLPNVNMTLEENIAKPQTVGRPMAFTKVKVVDDEGEQAAVGEVGEILMRGGLSFSGYWNDEAETSDVVRGGWIHTGDMGYVDEDGDYFVCGRRKNMYISGGENVFPSEVERCIEQHPDVAEACVLGVADPCWGEVGKALVVPVEGASLDRDELDAFLSGRLSTIKRPKFIELVDSLPCNAAGKRDMKLIRSMYAD